MTRYEYTIYKGYNFTNEIDISPSIYSFSNRRTIGSQIATCNITAAYKIINTNTPPGIEEIQIHDSIRIVDTKNTLIPVDLFKGFVNDIQIRGNKKIIMAEDVLAITKWREYHEDAEPTTQKVKDLFWKLIDKAINPADGYFTVGHANVAANPTPVEVKWKFDHANIFERLQKLATATGWQFYYTANDNSVHFKPRAYTTDVPVDFNIDQIDQTTYPDNMTVPEWTTSSNNNIVNKMTVIGGQVDGIYFYPLHGDTVDIYCPPDGICDDASLRFKLIPANINFIPPTGYLHYIPTDLSSWLNGVFYLEDDVATQVQLESGVHFIVVSDSNGYRIQLMPGSPGYGHDRWMRLNYPVQISKKVTSTIPASQNSIARYGVRDGTIYRTDISDSTTLQTIVDGITDLSSDKHDECIVKTAICSTPDCAKPSLGKAANVRDGVNNIIKLASDGMYISEITDNYPEGMRTVTITNKPLKDYNITTGLEDRIKRVEEDITKNQNAVSSYLTNPMTRDIDMQNYKIKNASEITSSSSLTIRLGTGGGLYLTRTITSTNAYVDVSVASGHGTIYVYRYGNLAANLIGSVTHNSGVVRFNFNIGDYYKFTAWPDTDSGFCEHCHGPDPNHDTVCAAPFPSPPANCTDINPLEGTITQASGTLYTYFVLI